MPIEYKNLDENDKNRIRGDIQGRDVDDTDYESLLPAWEAEHFSHTVLLEQATANGDEEAAQASRDAIAALEASVTNVRAGKKPDGSDHPHKPVRPTPPAPSDPNAPAPGPQPTPTDPNRPQADEPTPPAPAPNRRATAKKDEE